MIRFAIMKNELMTLNQKIFHYIMNEEVIYQPMDEIICISNNVEHDNKERLIIELRQNSQVGIYHKDDVFISENYEELNDWSIANDVLFHLTDVGILICMADKDARELIA